MQTIKSKLDTRTQEYGKNRTDMLEMLEEINGLLEEVSQGGGEEAMNRRGFLKLAGAVTTHGSCVNVRFVVATVPLTGEAMVTWRSPCTSLNNGSPRET